MPLSATFVADFSSFMTRRGTPPAHAGLRATAEELGPAADRGLDETQEKAAQIGRQTRQLARDPRRQLRRSFGVRRGTGSGQSADHGARDERRTPRRP